MNRKQIKLEDAVGKTIKAVIDGYGGNKILLTIGDDEFVFIEADGDDDDGATIDSSERTYFSRTHYRLSDLQKAFDAPTIAEWAAEDKQAVTDRKALQEANDRKRFEELKAMFGG